MICDTLDRLAHYRRIVPELEIIETFLPEAKKLKEGKHVLANGITASIMKYSTKPFAELNWETHRKHLDLQVTLSGQEYVCWTPQAALSEPQPYMEEYDYAAWEKGESSGIFLLNPKSFLLFFPWDGHMPKCLVNEPQKVKKAVFKIPISPDLCSLAEG